jgi:hypothetical protein
LAALGRISSWGRQKCDEFLYQGSLMRRLGHSGRKGGGDLYGFWQGLEHGHPLKTDEFTQLLKP